MGDLSDNGSMGGRTMQRPSDDLPDLPEEWGVIVIPDDLSELADEVGAICVRSGRRARSAPELPGGGFRGSVPPTATRRIGAAGVSRIRC